MINLLFAELSVVVTYFSLKQSEISMIVDPDYFLLLLLIPLLLFSAKRNPYPFGFFVLLSILTVFHYLPNSELFHSSLDLAYFLTGSENAKILEKIVSSRGVDPIYLMLISAFYVSSEVYESASRKKKTYENFPELQASLLSLFLSLLPVLFYKLIPTYPEAFYVGIAGVILILIYSVVRR
ncbi:hypothetical protein Ferp_1259 [Ferroglobus placidus DSM 10642]|uniref:Uncharacterized protein n=1 Tax=Ferroglobus placidus (strain DSM 10642 / AEDII12DO) TaxID=589924 RepID=D3RY50_FERPA|nr:hypothetical protein [Ferroglobus placidus]ADC65413.1 hypothetical protein Ferp_1259 [Ferroglobus placidus DSM 10642]